MDFWFLGYLRTGLKGHYSDLILKLLAEIALHYWDIEVPRELGSFNFVF